MFILFTAILVSKVIFSYALEVTEGDVWLDKSKFTCLEASEHRSLLVH
jgi:hypothetical protein